MFSAIGLDGIPIPQQAACKRVGYCRRVSSCSVHYLQDEGGQYNLAELQYLLLTLTKVSRIFGVTKRC